MTLAQTSEVMITPDNTRGNVLAMVTVLTYIFGKVTLSDIALIVTIVAGLASIALSIQKFIRDLKRKKGNTKDE